MVLEPLFSLAGQVVLKVVRPITICPVLNASSRDIGYHPRDSIGEIVAIVVIDLGSLAGDLLSVSV